MLTQIHVRWLLIYRILSEVCVMQGKKNTPAHGNSLAASPISYLLYYFCKKVFITSQFDVIVTNDFLFNVHLFFIETSSITYFELLSAELQVLGIRLSVYIIFTVFFVLIVPLAIVQRTFLELSCCFSCREEIQNFTLRFQLFFL